MVECENENIIDRIKLLSIKYLGMLNFKKEDVFMFILDFLLEWGIYIGKWIGIFCVAWFCVAINALIFALLSSVNEKMSGRYSIILILGFFLVIKATVDFHNYLLL